MNWRVEDYLREYESVQAYLRISRIYATYLDGVRWSSSEDALVNGDGRFFAFTDAIAEFVEGFDTGGRVVPFGYLLHWMDLLQNQRSLAAPALRQLKEIFYETGGNWRFAGAFCAVLSRDVPEAPNPPELENVGRRLRNRAFPIRWFTSQFHETRYPPEEPPLAPEVFEAHVIRALAAYDGDDLRTWLRTGRGPIHDAERLAQEPPLPPSLSRVLATLLERPRLAGAHVYVTQLIGALALPPRRFTPQELPVGGYSDVVTRGEPEHLLPAQFALDELEFYRRYAEKELLFFRREEPPVQNRQEMVVLLDQGVRTWGDVRLVLAAAAVAYGKQAIAKKTPFQLAATSNQGAIVDPVSLDGEMLGTLVEASDLTLNPGLAVERVLQAPSEAQRDVILLTNPRCLREGEVLDASRCLRPGDRLFAATLDRHGAAQLCEVRRGAALKVREFHIDFAPSQPAPRRRRTDAQTVGSPWTGDVETIPFPFRLGTAPHVSHFDFDYDGQWLLTASGQGCLHLWKLDGSAQEMLPRPCDKKVFKQVLSVIGVTGGFAVLAAQGKQLVLAHYDLVRRGCRIYALGMHSWTKLSLVYQRHEHRVQVFGTTMHELSADLQKTCVQSTPALDTSASWPNPVDDGAGGVMAYNRELQVLDSPSSAEPPAREKSSFCVLDRVTGLIYVRLNVGGTQQTYRFLPCADGKPCFVKASSHGCQIAGPTLALRSHRTDIGNSITLLSVPDGAVLREIAIKSNKTRITQQMLSFDGSHIALLRADNRVEVEPVFDRSLPSLCTRVGGYTLDTKPNAGDQLLVFRLGSSQQFWHVFDWRSGTLVHQYERVRSFETLKCLTPERKDDVSRPTFAVSHPACSQEDQERLRMVQGSSVALRFLRDPFGQIAAFNRDDELIAMFIAFRDRAAAWLPDGTRWGSLTLSLGPASPDAAVRIAQALLDAEKKGGQ